MNKEEKFIEEHNRLSSDDLQTNKALLSRFKIEKYSLFKKHNWSIEKLRRPFIFWLTSLSKEERKEYKEENKEL